MRVGGEGVGGGASLAPLGLLVDKTFPPSGGAGMCVRARWGFWPQEGVDDELGFLRGADVVEAEVSMWIGGWGGIVGRGGWCREIIGIERGGRVGAVCFGLQDVGFGEVILDMPKREF